LVFDAEAGVEVDEVGAAAEEDVLAVVDDFVGGGVGVGGGSAAYVGAAFEELDLVARGGEGAGCGEAGDAGAYDGGFCLGGIWNGSGGFD
jgi:hypothetical protein